MNKIIIGQEAKFTVSVARNGIPTPIAGAAKASIYTADGRREIVPPWSLAEADAGAAWAEGVAAVSMDASQTAQIPAGEAILMLSADFGVRRFRLVAETLTLGPRVSLFIEDIVVDEIRSDRLMAAATGILQDVRVSDAYIWDKVRAAESEMAHTLRVPLVPTKFFPRQPTPEQIEALDGLAWGVDPGYDYDPTLFHRDRWGFLVTQHRPLIEVEYMRLAYPSPDDNFFNVPSDWLRIDFKYGQIRLVPTSVVPGMALSAFGMTAMAAGNIVPSMIQLSYTAGLKDADITFPELLDAIKKKAVLKIVADAFLPQSGSISADGLSQSMSVDMSHYSDAIDEIVNGTKGSNGGLMTKIHGIRTVVM